MVGLMTKIFGGPDGTAAAPAVTGAVAGFCCSVTTAPGAPPNPKVDSTADPKEQPARSAASGKAKKGAARKSGMKVP